MRVTSGLACVAAVTLVGGGGARADEARTRAAARVVLAKYAEAVITVRLTVKSRIVFEGREGTSRQTTMEIAGTVVQPSGLTVVSHFSSNPSDLFPSREGGPKAETETIDVKLVLRDGRELPAKFVLRDEDLDLAFLTPIEQGLTLPHVGLEKGQLPEPLDDLVFLYPLGKSLNREVAIAIGKVRAVARKPRIFIVSDFLNGFQSLGCPVFNDAGRAVGLVVLRRAPAPPTGGSFRDVLEVLNPVVLTAEDVLQVAVQAITPKPAP